MAVSYSDLGMSGIWHGYGQRDQFRPRFDVSHCNANIPAPHIDDRRAAPIVARIHAEKILLPKVGMQRHDPVRTFFVRTTLVRPERRRAGGGLSMATLGVQCVGIAGPV